MKLFYTFLLLGALAAVGLLTYRSGFEFSGFATSGPKVRVKWTAPAAMPGGEPLELKQMKRTQDMLDSMASHLSGAELFIDRNAQAGEEVYGAPKPKQARYTVRLVLADGTLLEARPRQADWDGLDRAMAGTVEECMDKYRELRKRHGLRGPVREIRNF